MRSSPKRFRRYLALSLVVALSFVCIKGGELAWFAFRPMDSGSNKSIIIEVPKGAVAKTITSELVREGVLFDGSHFLKLGRLTGWWNKIKAGEYRIAANQTPVEIFSILSSGISVGIPLKVVEGDNLYQIAKKMEARKDGYGKEFLRLSKDLTFMKSLGLHAPYPPSLEGYYFPDTYQFTRKTPVKEIAQALFKRMQAQWTPDRAERASQFQLTRHQVLTLASMVEKETGAPEERAMISSVFHNRLRKHQRLESDPTTIYGIWEHYNGNLTRAHLRQPSPYNTYTLKGLPVGPIASPGIQAIDAALYPAKSDYLYFVSRNNGTHRFTATYKEHLEAVRNFQLNSKAREGKSWRDQLKRSTSSNSK